MTNEFKKITRPLRNGYIFFITIVLAVLIAIQFIIQYKLDNTSEDAALINMAGRQRMYGQRISKQVYNLSQSIYSAKKLDPADIDTVRFLVKRIKQMHYALANGDTSLGLERRRSEKIKAELDDLEPLLLNICSAAEMFFIPNPDSSTAKKAISIIKQNDLPFLHKMETIVEDFEAEAVVKHDDVKMVVLGLMLLAIIATILGFVFIFMPAIRKLNASNKLIKETTDRLFLATGTAKIGIWEYDVLEDSLIWDEAMYSIYNMPYEAGGKKGMIRKWMSKIHSEDVGRVKKELFKALDGGEAIDSEFRIIWSDGTIRHIQAKAVARHNRKGKVVMLTGTNLDLTELRIAEEEHRKSSENLEKAQEIAHLGSWEWDIISGEEKWSEQQYRIFGYQPNEVKANYDFFISVLHPNDKERVLQAVADALEGKRPYHEEFRITKKEGSICFIEAHGGVEHDSNGKAIKMVGTVLDITGRKQAEEELLKVNLELKALFDSGNHVSTISTDLEGTINYFSKGAETLLGYAAEEMVGKQSPAIIHIEEEVIQRGNELSEQFGREIRGFEVFVEYAKQGKYESREWTYKRKNGSTFPVQLVVTGIRNSLNELTGFLGIATDISWQKQKENELKATVNIVGEQNKRLLNFAYIVSHNLRSHSGNIEMILNILETAEDEEERNEMLMHLKGISKSLTETIVHLNEVVHIQTNVDVQKEKIQLKKYADKTIEVLSGTINSKGGKIINNIPADVEIDFNAAYMESVLLNFLSNGIKYSHPDRVAEVTLDVYFEDEKPVLQISDNGMGIDLKRYGEKIFGLYKTFHNNADAKGIGLFITKNQIEAMGGRVEIESEVNKGTTFKIFF